MGKTCLKLYRLGNKVKDEKKKKKTHENTTSSILKTVSTKPIKLNSTKIDQPLAETPYITILNNNSQIKKSKAKKMKYIVRIRKPIPFS